MQGQRSVKGFFVGLYTELEERRPALDDLVFDSLDIGDGEWIDLLA